MVQGVVVGLEAAPAHVEAQVGAAACGLSAHACWISCASVGSLST